MKTKRYSESNRNAAQKFLSKYSLCFESLQEPQKHILMDFLRRRRYLAINWMVSILVFASGLYMAHVYYSATNSMIKRVSENSSSVKLNDNIETMTLSEYGKECFEKGLSSGISGLAGFIWILYALGFTLDFYSRTKGMNAFLPSLKPLNLNGKSPQQ